MADDGQYTPTFGTESPLDDNPFADAVSLNKPKSVPESIKSPDESQSDAQTQAELPTPAQPRSPSPQTQAHTANAPAENIPDESAAPSPPKPNIVSPRKHMSARASSGAVRQRSDSGKDWTSRLENMELDSGPLGPLGGSASTESPRNEESSAKPQISRGHSYTSSKADTTMESINVESDKDSTTHAGPVPQRESPPKQKEQTPQYKLHIEVGDPHKIGDITSAHTVYKITTRTTAPQFQSNETAVQRRYRDFLWLYQTLSESHPGVIVPPPPEKQAVGRFEDSFIQNRRNALRTMLMKIAQSTALQSDPNFTLFLKSDTFSVDVKQLERERVVPPEARSAGFMSTFGFSTTSKFFEPDEWLNDKRLMFDNLEGQLRSLLKVADTVVKQRKSLAESTGEFGKSLATLSEIELDRSLGESLAIMADLQARIQNSYSRQAQQDFLTLGSTIDEYIRIIGSAKMAFASRQRCWTTWQNIEADLMKRKSALDKTKRQGRTQHDRISMLNAEVEDVEKRAHQSRVEFENIGQTLRQEIERFDFEKVEDLKSSVEIFLEAAIETQKELVEIWETYLTRVEGL